MEKRELICIGCPMGCPLTVELENGEIKTITGYTCKKGETYARKEVTNPTRIVTSTVRVEGGRPVPAFTSRYTSQHTPPVSPDQPRYFLGISNTSPKLSTAINEPAT